MTDEPTVHLRWSAPSTVAGPVASWLDEVELLRLQGLTRADDRRRFELSRHLVKVLVGELSGVAPSSVRLGYPCARCGRSHGRPIVVGPAPARRWSVSLAHAGDRVVAAAGAVGSVGSVGVDVERVGAVGFAGFDGVALTAAERAGLASVPPAERERARAALWVRKEAILKARGDGLRVDPSSIDVAAWPGLAGAVDVGADYAAAVAITLGEPHSGNTPGAARFALRSRQTQGEPSRTVPSVVTAEPQNCSPTSRARPDRRAKACSPRSAPTLTAEQR